MAKTKVARIKPTSIPLTSIDRITIPATGGGA